MFCVPLSRNPTDNSRAHSRLRAKLAIVFGASLTILTTRTLVRISLESFLATSNPPLQFCRHIQIFCVPLSRNPTDNSSARSAHRRLRAKLAIFFGASLTILTTRTLVRIGLESFLTTTNPPLHFCRHGLFLRNVCGHLHQQYFHRGLPPD